MSEQFVVSKSSELNDQQNSLIDWQKVCCSMLEKSLPLDSVNTQPNSPIQTSQESPLFLKIFSTRQRDFRLTQQHPQFKEQDSPKLAGYSPEKLLHKLLELDLPSLASKRLAIIGEGGTGKTLFLRQIAQLLLGEKDDINTFNPEFNGKIDCFDESNFSQIQLIPKTECFPIWISPSQLKTLSVKDYLLGSWLKQAMKDSDQDLEIWQTSFHQLLKSGKVWLLADGIDYLFLEPDNSVEIEPLSGFWRSLEDWAEAINLILTCRTQTWKLDIKGLAKFERYQTQELIYPTEVEATINQWFEMNQTSIDQRLQEEPEPDNLGQQLCQILAKPGQESIQKWLTNPLRLVLCCRFWQKRPLFFPKNSAELYEQLVTQFYQWKAEQLPTSRSQQQELNQQLGELAKQILLNNQSYTQPILHTDIENLWGEETPFLRLFLKLEWLIPRGLCSRSEIKSNFPQKYGFNDRTFQDYFAALAIADWHFFLDISAHIYRLFEVKWQNVILFWFGRSDINQSEKDDFVKALITFKDNFSGHNFYGKRAYFLAVQILSEFQDCSYQKDLLTQFKKWLEDGDINSPTFKQSARMILNKTHRPFAINLFLSDLKKAKSQTDYQQISRYLSQLGRTNLTVIQALEEHLKTLANSAFAYTVAEILGVIAPGNQKAITVFIQALEQPQKEETYPIIFSGLGKIAQGNTQAIAAVVDFLGSDCSLIQQRHALNCLGIIGEEDSLAIASLLQRFRIYREGPLRCQTAEILEKIDPGNPTAISVLLHFLQPNQTMDIRKQAIYSLGETSASSPQAIAALIELLQRDEDIFIRWLAVSSLTKISQGNPNVIRVFEQLIDEFAGNLHLKETGWLIKEIMEALAKIDPTNPVLLKTLVQLIQSDLDLDSHQEIAESLGKLDPGNPTAIAVLGQLLKKNEDEFIQRQAAASLGKIDFGNLEALMMLIHLLQHSQNLDVRRLSAKSLGEIGINNAAAIAALIRTALITPDKETRRAIVQSLGKIAIGNREVCQTFIDLLRTQTDQTLRLEIAENLIKILSRPLILFIIYPLKELLLNPDYKKDIAIYEIFWHCIQSLSYQSFYQAWYQLPFDETSIKSSDSLAAIAVSKTSQTEQQNLNLGKSLNQFIQNNPLLDSLIQIIWIDCHKFLEPDDPVIDIYDQMLCQNCPEFENGIPDNLAKLRLYGRLLQKHQPDRIYIWLFDHSAKDCSAFPPKFLEKLSTFQINIGIISNQKNNFLPHFSADSPQLIPTIIDWIQTQINKP